MYIYKYNLGWYKRAPIAVLRQAKYYLPRQAAVPQQALLRHPGVLPLVFIPRVLRLMYCGSYKFEGSITAVHEPQYMRDKKYLVYCGASCTAAAAVGIDAPQFESFYTVPYFFLKKRAKKLQCTKFAMYPVERHKYLVH